MSRTNYSSLLVLLGPNNALQDFDRPDFFHSRFFLHCTAPNQCIETIRTYANIDGKMDIFLPHSLVQIIHDFRHIQNSRRHFHLYCDTEHFVNQYKRLQQSNICEQVFHANQLEKKLYRTAHAHLLHCINDLEKRSEAGDVDAGDLLLPMGELFGQSAAKINDIIRQKSCLPEQPVET